MHFSRKKTNIWEEFLRGLNYRRDIDCIINSWMCLDRKCELSGAWADYAWKNRLQNDLNKILREEEIKWYQRSKERDIKEDNSNTKYFMIKASGGKRKKKIFRFIQDEGIIQWDEQLLKYGTGFYKELFGKVDHLPVSLSIPLPDWLSDEDKGKLSD